ncbi:MAG: hypothetical protein J1E37_04890 [Prevotella sp.]|nr:hypothetical protein [Prevotella sp.]
MKKISVFLMIAAIILTMGSCGNKTQQVPFDNGDSAEIANADPTIYGISGVATTMNSLQLITDTGDTLTFDISTAIEQDKVFGGIQSGDRMAVIPTSDKTSALMVINQSTLLGSWVMPNPLDGSDEVGIRIKEGGIAESIEQPTISYRTWRLIRGQLEIVQVEEEGSGIEETYLYDIVLLGPDTLIYKDKEDTFEYSRQRAKKGYGENIKLEEASEADFQI